MVEDCINVLGIVGLVLLGCATRISWQDFNGVNIVSCLLSQGWLTMLVGLYYKTLATCCAALPAEMFAEKIDLNATSLYR